MKEFLVGGKVTSLDLSKDETKLAVCSRDDKIQVRFWMRTEKWNRIMFVDDSGS